jgi:hypothetical protein
MRERIANLQVLEGALEDLVKQCAQTRSHVSCLLIEALASSSDAIVRPPAN